jgi:hypothetical protein
MRNEHIKDYLWSEMISGIDNKTLLNDCLLIEKYLEYKLPKIPGSMERGDLWGLEYGTFTGRNFNDYNIFTFPSNELTKLLNVMRNSIAPVLIPNTNYMIQSWLNVYRQNGFIDWHSHWPAQSKTIHGFYCVNSEDTPSYTEYRFPDINDDITTVHSKDGLLVFGKSENDRHRSSQGWNSNIPRITIAFDIVPVPHLQDAHNEDFFNNWPINHFFTFI